ncbi:MAG: hypothetical protein RR394_07825 [Oscillospiraceae bacterium]
MNIIPMQLIQKYTKLNPELWSLCEDFIKDRPLPWDTRCYLPIAAGLALQNFLKFPREAIYLIPALAAWRNWKEIYSFDATLAETLFEQAQDNAEIPCEIILSLPFPSIYIEAGSLKFFASIENDVNDGRFELRFARIDENLNSHASCLHLVPGYTLTESLAAAMDEAPRVKENFPPEQLSKIEASAKKEACYDEFSNIELMGKMLQLVLYVCADNADEVESEKTKKTYHPGSEIKDKFREIRQWDVGNYVGSAIRESMNSTASHSQENEPNTGTPKRPHIRRGHWHHFWVGGADEKKLIIKWISPIFVAGADLDDTPPTRINPVR